MHTHSVNFIKNIVVTIINTTENVRSLWTIEVYVCDVSIPMATDIDQDGLISREDMYEMLDVMTDEPLKDSVKRKVVDEVSRTVRTERGGEGGERLSYLEGGKWVVLIQTA